MPGLATWEALPCPPWLLLIFPPPPCTLLASSDAHHHTYRDPHIAKEGELMGLSLANGRPSSRSSFSLLFLLSRQPVSASVRPGKGRGRGKAGAGKQGKWAAFFWPPSFPTAAALRTGRCCTLHTASWLPGVRQCGQTGRARSSGLVSWEVSLWGLDGVCLGSSSLWAWLGRGAVG